MSKEDLMDLVTKEDMTCAEMKKTQKNQHMQAGTMFKNGKKVKPKKSK